MGIHGSKEMSAGCFWVSYWWWEVGWCREHDKVVPGPAPVTEPQHGTTLVRIHIGSFEDWDMGGSIPGVALFTEYGKRIGQVESESEDTADGGFKDILIKHSAEAENVRPAYILLQASKMSICISAVSMQFPDGTKMFFTGEDMAMCGRVQTRPSRTFFGPNGDQPQCFWVRGAQDHRGTGEMGARRLSFHLPDYIWSDARRKAYREDKELACGSSPRFHDVSVLGDQMQWFMANLSDPIYIFNPPIDYDPLTHFDQYPRRVLEWRENQTDFDDLSDRPFKPRPAWIPAAANLTMLGINGTVARCVNKTAIDSTRYGDSTVPFPHGQVEEHRIRIRAPRLVISKRDLSAVEQCRHGQWRDTDYVSLSEQIYCDMQSRSMLFLCNEHTRQSCWDLESKTLRGLAADRRFTPRAVPGASIASSNVSVPADSMTVSWKATGALFGYTYQDIATVN